MVYLFFLCLSLLRLFLRLWTAILWRLRFLPQGIRVTPLYALVNDFVQRILDDPLGARVFQFRYYRPYHLLVYHGFDVIPAVLRQARNGRLLHVRQYLKDALEVLL